MVILFWILWVINVLTLLLVIAGMGFRSSFSAGVDLNIMMIVGLIVVLAASLIIRFSYKHHWISLVIVALPVLMMFLQYGVEKMTEKPL